MKEILFLSTAFSLFNLIFGELRCSIDDTKEQNITNFLSCRDYSTVISDKVCCYVKGKDKNETSISAYAELSSKENDTLKDLKYLEGYYSKQKSYYLTADCNLGKEIALCDPDDRKSDTPLSKEICSNYTVVRLLGVDSDSNCCYVTGINDDKCLFIYWSK